MSEETTQETKPLTIRERLLAEAKLLAHQEAERFNLVTQFGFPEDEIFYIDINGRKIPYSTRGSVRTDLEDLTEDIRAFLEEHLPQLIFIRLLDQYLNKEEK